MIYDHNTQKVRVATDQEKMFLVHACATIIDDVDSYEFDEMTVDADLPHYEAMAKNQRLSLMAEFIRRSLNDKAEPFPISAWADSVGLAVLYHVIGQIDVETDMDDGSEEYKSIQFRWRKPFFEFTHEADFNFDEEDRFVWRSHIEEFGSSTGLTCDADDEELATFGQVDPYDLQSPPTHWVGQWEYDLNWLFQIGMNAENTFESLLNSKLLKKVPA